MPSVVLGLACAGSSRPTFPVSVSENHTRPCRSSAMLCGAEVWTGSGPSTGSSTVAELGILKCARRTAETDQGRLVSWIRRPMRLSAASENHTAPSPSIPMPSGMLQPQGKSTRVRSVPSGATRSAPMRSAPCSANQTTVLSSASSATVICTGRRVLTGGSGGSGTSQPSGTQAASG